MPSRDERLVRQPSPAPTRKMEAVGLAGAAVTVLMFLAALFDLPLTIDVAHAIVALVTAVVAFGAGYLRHERAVAVSPPRAPTFPDDTTGLR